MAKQKFPVFGTILLILGIVWLISEIYNVNINVPWIPVVLIVVAVGIIFNRFRD